MMKRGNLKFDPMTKLTLKDFETEIDDLLTAVNVKIVANLVSPVNMEFKDELEIRMDALKELLNAIEIKLKRCQEIYHIFFEKIDVAYINGISAQPAKKIDFEIITNSLGDKKTISVETGAYTQYKEIIDTNFQYFILSIASLYENFVFLSEMLLKKTIVHHKSNVPLSTPLATLIDYRRMLIRLDYRTSDAFIACIDKYATYFDEFLPSINILRNSFIHGYKLNLAVDGSGSYCIINPKVKSKLSSAKLEIDNFADEVVGSTLNFARDLFVCLASMVNTAPAHIPI